MTSENNVVIDQALLEKAECVIPRASEAIAEAVAEKSNKSQVQTKPKNANKSEANKSEASKSEDSKSEANKSETKGQRKKTNKFWTKHKSHKALAPIVVPVVNMKKVAVRGAQLDGLNPMEVGNSGPPGQPYSAPTTPFGLDPRRSGAGNRTRHYVHQIRHADITGDPNQIRGNRENGQLHPTPHGHKDFAHKHSGHLEEGHAYTGSNGSANHHTAPLAQGHGLSGLKVTDPSPKKSQATVTSILPAHLAQDMNQKIKLATAEFDDIVSDIEQRRFDKSDLFTAFKKNEQTHHQKVQTNQQRAMSYFQGAIYETDPDKKAKLQLKALEWMNAALEEQRKETEFHDLLDQTRMDLAKLDTEEVKAYKEYHKSLYGQIAEVVEQVGGK